MSLFPPFRTLCRMMVKSFARVVPTFLGLFFLAVLWSIVAVAFAVRCSVR